MKANRAARVARGEEGVSSVVAAVLLFALFTSALTMWALTTLPQWVADREQAHAQDVRQSFGAMQAGLDALSAAEDAGPSSVQVDLGPSPVTPLQQAAAQGLLSFGGTVQATGEFTGESLLVADGAPSVLPDDEIDEGGGDVLVDVVGLKALVVRLGTRDVGNGDLAWATVVADDGDNTVQAVMTHHGKEAGSGPNVAGCLNSELRLEVTVTVAPAAPVTTTQALLCELATDLTGYTIDLASPLYPFIEGAGRLEAPYTVTLTDDSSGGSAVALGSFGAAYTDSSGLDQSAGSGQPVDYGFDETGARLVYAPAYQRFTGPGVAWEFGGIVLEQADGSVVDQGPAFSLSVEDGVGYLSWTLVTLTGTGEQVGTGQATALLRHSITRDHVLVASGAEFTLVTPAAQAWRAYFEDAILLAGADGEAAFGGSGTTAVLELGGGSITRWVVHLRLVTAGVTIL